MGKNRCIYCMTELKDHRTSCPVCHKTFWEYEWKEQHLHPYTVLNERYEIGAVLSESSMSVCYMAFDKVLEQRVVVKEFFPKSLVYRVSGEEAQELLGREEKEENLTGKKKASVQKSAVFSGIMRLVEWRK